MVIEVFPPPLYSELFPRFFFFFLIDTACTSSVKRLPLLRAGLCLNRPPPAPRPPPLSFPLPFPSVSTFRCTVRCGRFVLMAIELGFSFIMGVTCLVFSVSLVRKLQEDDHPPRGYTGGGNGSGGISTGSTNSQPFRTRDGALGGGGLRVGVVRGKNDEDLRRSGSPVDPRYGGRGIGSLLRRNAGSRVDLYEDSDDDDYAEAMPMTVGGGGRLDAGMLC